MALSLIFLTSCQNIGKFPASKFYEMVPSEGICGEYIIIKQKPLTFKHIQDLPLDKCPKIIFGFTPEDTAKVMSWIREIQSY